MLQKKEKLMLVEIKEVEFKDKDSGLPLKKFKYTFLADLDVPYTGYSDTKKHADRLVDASKFVPEKSHEYSFEGKVWDGVVTWRLLV